MERVHIGGRGYTDPDVLSLIGSGPDLVDPRAEVVRRARELNRRLRNLGSESNPRTRIEMLASLAGIKVAAMAGPRLGSGSREALVYRDSDGSRRAFYDPTYSEGRINFSIAHEIIHSFFPNSTKGARFRTFCTEDSREANELERLCDLGAAELLMPIDDFLEAIGDNVGLWVVPTLSERFGSSYEATVYRLATSNRGSAIAGLVRYRHRKDELHKMAPTQQRELFTSEIPREIPSPKYRRQSFHCSNSCSARHNIPWNKSFDESSVVYRARDTNQLQRSREALPNQSGAMGGIEAVIAPYQRPQSHEDNPDVLFIWWR
jgi:Zn-dependent peptidase ImmA (M78 family)